MASIKGYFDGFADSGKGLLYRREVFFGHDEKIVNTTSGFTVTANSGTAAVDNLGTNPYARACASFVGGGGATNGHNFAEVAIKHKLNAAKQVRIMFGYYSEAMAVSAFCLGLGTLSTTMSNAMKSGGTYLANVICINKWATATNFRLQSRKASGTTEELAVPEPALASSIWYDYDILITPDPTTAGKGIVQVARQANLGGYSLVTPYPLQIATQMPDTVGMSLEFQYQAGDTGTTLKDAISHLVMEVQG